MSIVRQKPVPYSFGSTCILVPTRTPHAKLTKAQTLSRSHLGHERQGLSLQCQCVGFLSPRHHSTPSAPDVSDQVVALRSARMP